jgi:pimeloyl-ACP methyl ester carboxylesterase
MTSDRLFPLRQRLELAKNSPICKAFRTFDEAVAFYRSAFSDYGELDDICWRHIARHSIQWSESEQTFNLLFDRSIIRAYHLYRYYSMPVWSFWRNIKIPILILAGEKSDFLPLSLAMEMQRTNRRARIVKIPGVGHTPMLMQSDQIDPIVQFLIKYLDTTSLRKHSLIRPHCRGNIAGG